MKSIIMKKLFTLCCRAIARVCYAYPLYKHINAIVNINSAAINAFKRAFRCDFKFQTNLQLVSDIFFTRFTTYRKINPLLLTYSARITHTYRPMPITSFNLSRPADVLPSVPFGNFPKSISITSGYCNSYLSI